MNVKKAVAAAILLLPVVASAVIAKPATAESQVRLGDYNSTVVVDSRGDYHDGHFQRHHRKIWVPGYWKVNKFGYRYWVPGYYNYVFFK